MQILVEILNNSALKSVDGRPLFRYTQTDAQHRRLGEMLRTRLATGEALPSTAAGFVYWAAEYIRANFKAGDHLSWDFIFRGIGLKRDRNFGISLVERGLRWWARKVLHSDGGQRRFLYSLMAEGGLPEGLIVTEGQKRRSLLNLVSEVEKAGHLGPEIVSGAVQRCLGELPQVFQDQGIAELLADLALKLVELRGHIPLDVSQDVFEAWLNQNCPNWQDELPLRMSPAVLNTLILPALRSARAAAAVRQTSAVRRELRLRNDSIWVGIIVVEPSGVIAAQFLPLSTAGLRLRLLPRDTDLAARLTLVASPEESGWSYIRFGGAGPLRTTFALDRPLLLAAYADGSEKGELVLDPGRPSPEEAVSLWRAADPSEGEKPTCLVPQPGNGRSKAGWLWVLATKDIEPFISGDLTLGAPQEAEGGTLWPVTGRGQIRFGTETLHVTTGADSESEEAQIQVFGSIMYGWRRLDGTPIFLGQPSFAGESGARGLYTIAPLIRPGLARALGSKVVEWEENGEILARTRLVILPEALRLLLREMSAGQVRLTASGLDQGWVLHLSGGSVAEVALANSNGAAEISLTVTGRAPADLRLQLRDPAQGAVIDLIALWPARVGMIVDPQGQRLDRDLALSFDALVGWRAVVPYGQSGTLRLCLTTVPAAPIALSVSGEFRLAAILPLIRMLLAQGGPDARVNLRLVVAGDEGRRLELGRFDTMPTIEGAILRNSGDLRLHAVDLNDPTRRIDLATSGNISLQERLALPSTTPPEGDDALWLVQAVSEEQGRIRAFVWPGMPVAFSTRDARIGGFATQWSEMMRDARNPGWKRIWSLIEAATSGGNAAILDQVQALAKVPEAAIALAFRVPETDVHEALAIESLAPIFLPTVSVQAFEAALRMDFSYHKRRFGLIYDGETKAKHEAGAALARRIGIILSQRPDLAGHFSQAMNKLGIPPFYESAGVFKPLPKFANVGALENCAGEMARQAETLGKLPIGPVAITARIGQKFSPDLRSIIDAPIVCAEVALGLRPKLTPVEVLQILALRLKDSPYFDNALPLALVECAIRPSGTDKHA